MKIFVSYSVLDSEFVMQVINRLKTSCDEVFCFEREQRADQDFMRTIGEAIDRCDTFLIFIGGRFSEWQQREATAIAGRMPAPPIGRIRIRQRDGSYPDEPAGLRLIEGTLRLEADPRADNAADQAAWSIMRGLGLPLQSFDGLPLNPSIFSYEKNIIEFFARMIRLKLNGGEPTETGPGQPVDERQKERDEEFLEYHAKLLDGCPPAWPRVTRWGGASDGDDTSMVVAAALSKYHKPVEEACLIRNQLCFPEAAPRPKQDFHYPRPGGDGVFRVGILVAGGIAPGINAVIDGIVQRHWQDAVERGYLPLIYGIVNGIGSVSLDGAFVPGQALVALAPTEGMRDATPMWFQTANHWKFTAKHRREGGSIIGTSRADDLIRDSSLMPKVVLALQNLQIDILYVIGGDGSMRLARAIWHHANVNPPGSAHHKRLSVVGVPKTMDNDILWVWQSFGFMSAVEKAREVLAILDSEIKSNPRLCILQLFGSDSGFVVSHTVAASGSDQCDAALIPEVPFSLIELASYLRKRMRDRTAVDPTAIVPSGFVVMAETAIPTDAICYIDKKGDIPPDLLSDWDFIKDKIGVPEERLDRMAAKIDLSEEEKNAIYQFHRMSKRGERVRGQTGDALRSAGLRIVSRGLPELIVPDSPPNDGKPQPDWARLRIVTNEPRHVLRSIAPTVSDIVMGQRLGTLAVENAMAGFTDFMVSQWLTEYVLVPLGLVVLGRKRIPMDGMFWKSVLATTGQRPDLDGVGKIPPLVEVKEGETPTSAVVA